ncbi:hypothetical protein GCM10007147_16240 [Nocardiopsis kunsanensis]|uniref:Uncharacterized protein n=1 Tax=Nocardiopsis kunsanensis TaxID=141693 RepID=A0A918XAI2_9ACTN|nr:hypothetical protein GCM10007147_16240 [Nocardiopsis kunsanensis]
MLAAVPAPLGLGDDGHDLDRIGALMLVGRTFTHHHRVTDQLRRRGVRGLRGPVPHVCELGQRHPADFTEELDRECGVVADQIHGKLV